MATEDKRIDQLPETAEVDPTSLLVVQRGDTAERVSIEQLQRYLGGLVVGGNAVLYIEQTLTEEQQRQARENIRCGSVGEVSNESDASGTYAHAEGLGTKAIGHCAHAEGAYTEASGAYSHAEGVDTEASGKHSHAEGYRTEARRKHQHVQGTYNIADTKGENYAAQGQYVHIVGNGTDEDNRSNAHTLDWEGVPWYAGDRVMLGGTGMDDENAVALMPIFAPQQLTEEQKQQARANIGAAASGEGGSGLSAEAATLLITILSGALYASDQSGNIKKLKKALLGGDDPEQPQTTQNDTAALGVARLGQMRLGIPYRT